MDGSDDSGDDHRLYTGGLEVGNVCIDGLLPFVT
jgi:hypothetical protein